MDIIACDVFDENVEEEDFVENENFAVNDDVVWSENFAYNEDDYN